MANKSSEKNKGIIIGVCAALVVIALVVVGIVMAVKNGGGGLSDAYFKSDGTKYVLTLDAEDMSFDSEEMVPVKTHLVYTFSGDEITGLKGYYEYDNVEKAEAAYNYLVENQKDDFKSIVLDGKYVVVEADESEYEDLTTEDVKQQIDYMEAMKNMESNGSDSVEE